VDPGAHSIANLLIPILQESQTLNHWYADGWSLAKNNLCLPGKLMFDMTNSDSVLMLGSQTNFEKTQRCIFEAQMNFAGTIFYFDHWKNYGNHFKSDCLPDVIIVPDVLCKKMLLQDVGYRHSRRVQILPHLALKKSIDYIVNNERVDEKCIAVLLDPTEKSDGLGYCWKSSLEEMKEFHSKVCRNKRVLIKCHPRQDPYEIYNFMNKNDFLPSTFSLVSCSSEELIARAAEVWGMTTVALIAAKMSGKKNKKLSIGEKRKRPKAIQ
jgi:hypothetical protein